MSTPPEAPLPVPGVRVGHVTDADGRTGCTVVRLPEGTVASGEIRGGAPATREFELLDPLRTVQRLDAVCLSGGSAFGLAACDGVMTVLEEEGVGQPTPAGPVPIVVGLSLYDLAVGDASARPGAADGARAAREAVEGPAAVGSVGAGAGATVGKWLDPDDARPGALVTATAEADGVTVWALVACNAAGWPVGEAPPPAVGDDPFGGDTTIGVVVTDAALDKVGCHLVAQSAHDGLARSLTPTHTTRDGDAFVVAATGRREAVGDPRLLVDLVRWLAADAVAAALADLPGEGRGATG